MKYFKRSGLYKASNVTFNPEANEAMSYDWWCFFKKINGKNVFNSFPYSPTTIKHQYKVRNLLNELGIKIDLDIKCPVGLHIKDCDLSVNEYYTTEIKVLKEQINRPRSQERKNLERKAMIAQYAKKCVEFKLLKEREQ